ncbi:hypothetical protein RDABS01_034897 [Bienertia sinuspersici]
MEKPNTLIWNTVIRGQSLSSPMSALDFYIRMLLFDVLPNSYTFPCILKSCAKSRNTHVGKQIHGHILKFGLELDAFVHTSLINMYASRGYLEDARKLFDEIPVKDVVSWNAMISGYVQSSQFDKSITFFREMLRAEVMPNESTMLSVLSACSQSGDLESGKWVRSLIEENGFRTKLRIVNALIDMYAKCGDIEAAKQVFDRMGMKSLPSWNALISGLAIHGDATHAFDLFSTMVDEGFKPDDITFVGVLSACTQAGLVDLGRKYFNSMIQDYKISPKLHHYGCMIDLLGRSGLFNEAEALIETMPMEPDGAIWGSLLAACKLHKKVEMAEKVASHLFELEPTNPGPYVLLSNIYAGASRWDDVAKIRTKLNDLGMKKVPGCTLIEIDSIVHEFLVGDKLHPQSEAIYEMLDEVDRLLALNGHVPDTSEVLYDMDEDWKEGALSHHSERNLRVCGNCHSATKLISKIFNREIIARDRNLFHHFKDGKCSCMDQW